MVETIGFIISLIALFFLFIKQKASTMQNQGSSDYQDVEETDDPFKAFFKAIEKEGESREIVRQKPPHPPKKKEQSKKGRSYAKEEYRQEEYRIFKSTEKRPSKSSLDNHPIKPRVLQHEEIPAKKHVIPSHRPGEEPEEQRISRLQSAVGRLQHRRDLVIYQEVLKKPKSLRSETPFHEY